MLQLDENWKFYLNLNFEGGNKNRKEKGARNKKKKRKTLAGPKTTARGPSSFLSRAAHSCVGTDKWARPVSLRAVGAPCGRRQVGPSGWSQPHRSFPFCQPGPVGQPQTSFSRADCLSLTLGWPCQSFLLHRNDPARISLLVVRAPWSDRVKSSRCWGPISSADTPHRFDHDYLSVLSENPSCGPVSHDLAAIAARPKSRPA
jgi:hypothetical protein